MWGGVSEVEESAHLCALHRWGLPQPMDFTLV